MAKLSDETLIIIFNLLRQLAEDIEEASATEWNLFEGYGENETTIAELEELQNSKERLREPYFRLHRLLIGILESQPTATAPMLNLLIQTIEQAQAAADASQASIREVKRNWNLP
ncbi:MAG: hypothetical protein ACRC2S_16540 [Waterburya sp.]